ncbi:hypothetical protein WJ542_23350 [Paraburkholderia sp. B3]|uniref:hypothetical protein n=1 Tax=Paraburkholderia sp. B3 TaxID=3134791 RepID=UPI003981CFF9
MLSPHELATLMLIRSAPEQIDMTRVELDTLLDCDLISLEPRAGERRLPMLTAAGAHVLEVAARLDGPRSWDSVQ